MKRICNQCQTEMVEVYIMIRPRLMDEIVIKKMDTGILNSVIETPKATLCPSCGNLNLYVENFKKFVE